MAQNNSFAHVLEQFVARDGRHARQLSHASEVLFGVGGRIPHNTISRWLRQEVQRPRHWHDVARIAAVLRLEPSEANELLQAAGHPPLADLRGEAQTPTDRALVARWEHAPQPIPITVPFQAPPLLPTFVGRAREIERIKSLLGLRPHPGAPEPRRLISIEGMSGVGKTALAIHLAYLLRPHFPGGVLWASPDQSHPLTVLHSFASAFGFDVNPYQDISTRSNKVRELLAGRRILMVLDDVPGDELVAPLLPPSGPAAVILTTRRRDLATADLGHRLVLTPFEPAQGEGLALFRRILDRPLTHVDVEDLKQLAELLGHLPLAIDIAANRLRHEAGWQPADFLRLALQQEERLDLLQRGERGVQISFSISSARMMPEQQRFFAALGAFAGADFDAAAAAAVGNTGPSVAAANLDSLHGLSLIQAAGEDRYTLHPLLRDYAVALQEDGADAVRMVDYYIALAHDHADNFRVLDREGSNLLAALETANVQKLEQLLLQGVRAFYPYLRTRGLFESAKHYLLAAEGVARSREATAELVRILQDLGHAVTKLGQPERAREYYSEALTLVRESPEANKEVPLIADLLLRLGALAHRQGSFNAAEIYYQEALELVEPAEDPTRAASLFTNLGLVRAMLGDSEEAAHHYEQALPLARKSGRRDLLVTVLQNLGDLVERRGDYALAESHYREGFQLARAIGDPELKSRMLGNLGLVACELGNYSEAAAHFRQGLRLAEGSGLRLQICRQRANLGRVACRRRDYELARLHYEEALNMIRGLGFPGDLASILNQWAACCVEQQAYARAAELFDEALTVAQSLNLQQEVAASYFGLAQLAAIRGNVAEAEQLAANSRRLYEALHHRRAEEVRWWLAELPGQIGDV